MKLQTDRLLQFYPLTTLNNKRKTIFKVMLKYILLFTVFFYAMFAAAQMQVRDEPRHHNVFENEFVRILDVHLGPKDTTLYHLHNTASIFIIFTNTNVGSQLMGKQPQKGANITGAVSYDSLATPRIHRVWNDDTAWFHVMDIELTAKVQGGNTAVLQNPSLQLLFNQQQVNGYSIELKTGNALQLPASPSGYLIVSKGEAVVDYKLNGTVQHRIMKPAHYIWVSAENNFSIQTKESKPANFIVLQLK